MSARNSANAILHVDALEFYAEQGGAPIERLRLESAGAGRVDLVRAGKKNNGVSSVEWSALCRHYLGAPLELGHDIRRLRNGAEIFPAMLESIRSANRSIEFLFFIFSDGGIARKFCDALIERAEKGVQVRVLLDAVGSKALGNDLIGRLKQSPVKLEVFHPVSSWKIWRLSSRNHRKILVVDSRVAYIGGVGIDDNWTGDGGKPSDFRDIHFRMTGPVVGQARAAFFNNWASAGGLLPDPLDQVPIHSHPSGGTSAAVVASSAGSVHARVTLLFQLLLRCARHSVQIVTPYFVPGWWLTEELRQACRRGVTTRLMVSGKRSDHLFPLWAGRESYSSLLESGAIIDEYDLTLLHTKLVIVDERIVMFGSPNMNQRSQTLDEELAVITHDEELARQLLDDTDQDRRHCRRIDPERWAHRSMAMRASEKLGKLIAPQL